MKDRKVWAIISIEVPRVCEFVNVNIIKRKVNSYICSILPKLNIKNLSGWGLKLYISLMCTDFIGIGKKFIRYPSDAEYEILISIPIQDKTQAVYGLPFAEDGRIGYFHPENERYAQLIIPGYEKYADLEQYIIESIIKAINLGFAKGFTCHGKK